MKKQRIPLSEFCKLAGVSLKRIIEESGLSSKDLEVMYNMDILKFNDYVETLEKRGDTLKACFVIFNGAPGSEVLDPEEYKPWGIYTSKEDIACRCNTTVKRVQAWIILGIDRIKKDGLIYINYGAVCDFIASGRA